MATPTHCNWSSPKAQGHGHFLPAHTGLTICNASDRKQKPRMDAWKMHEKKVEKLKNKQKEAKQWWHCKQYLILLLTDITLYGLVYSLCLLVGHAAPTVQMNKSRQRHRLQHQQQQSVSAALCKMKSFFAKVWQISCNEDKLSNHRH